MDQQIKHTDESAEKKQIAKDMSEAIDRMPALSLAKLRGFVAGLQAAEEIKKAG